ncbi:hypothetical protein [uncultured Kordia sp.]|uniref:leucine-rich repeat domain-containing protein n=1 Tax=uncultured Kordia sp. TaxID=507699 RepID=UPI002611B2D2|nr:hypothetical protein [uncultured Kordia sp.]
MKQKLLYILLLACISHTAFAQTTTIPDANFEAFLEANNMGNGIPNDQLVTTANIENVTVLSFSVQNRAGGENTSNISNISDLTGIEDFTALEELNCNALQLVHLDLTSNLNLRKVFANDNALETINVNGLTALERLECERNVLESLSLNTNPAITTVLANNNSFQTIHIKNGNNSGIDTFRAQNNQNIICINVDNTAEGFLSEWDLDTLSGFGNHCGETYVPDADFETELETNGMGNGIANDNYVITANIENVTTLDLIGDILDLTGIEDFTALINLNCAGTDITTVNLSALTQLETLNCENTNLVSLDLTANTNLTTLNASGTNISELDLSQNSALTALRVSSNPNLTALNIKNGNNTNITEIFTGGTESNVSCILVDDPAYSRENWTVANTTLFSDVDCATTEVPSEALRDRLSIIPGLDGAVSGSHILNHKAAILTTLSITGSSVNDLTGIEAFTGLQELSCINTNITSLDLSQNTALTKLYCNDNALTSLNISQNVVLTELHCFNNNIASLDVSQNVLLTELYCSNTNLTSLDLTANTNLTTLYASGINVAALDLSQNSALTILTVDTNPNLVSLNIKNGNNVNITDIIIGDASSNLACILVDDPVYSRTNWSFVNPMLLSDIDCALTEILDANFVDSLHLIPELDGAIAGSNILNHRAATITVLDVSNTNNINDLTGIEAFTGLQELDCSNTSITSLNLSQNTALTKLYCHDNALTSLDVSQNVLLTELYCFDSDIANLDLSQNTVLTKLHCYNNDIVNLNVSQNPLLTELHCYSNDIATLDLSQSVLLTELHCNINNMANLDVSQNVLLTELYCNDNILTELDVSLNTQLIAFDCSSNQLIRLNLKNGNNGAFTTSKLDANPNLSCIKVDDPTASYLADIWVKDAQSSYDLTCGETYISDDNFENYLETHDASGNEVLAGEPTSMGNGVENDNYVTTTAINTVTQLYVGGRGIADFTGIQDFVGLTQLRIESNTNTTIDISNLTNLERFTAHSNGNLTSVNLTGLTNLDYIRINNTSLTSLDVSTNTALEVLWAFTIPTLTDVIDFSNNTLLRQVLVHNSGTTGELDLSNLTNLKYLDCRNNDLSTVNVKNGNNANVTFFNATNNPNLSCIQVDDRVYSTNQWSDIDAQSFFTTDCRQTNIPDANFENYLETHDATGNTVSVGDPTSMGNGVANDNSVSTIHIENVTNLEVSNKGIVSLTGIEDFTALTNLNCSRNQIQNLDVTANTALIEFNCFDNELTSLDVTQNVLLNTLSVNDNQLTSIDLTNNTAIDFLYLENNQISNLDLSQNVQLSYFVVGNNQLTSLDFSQNTLITDIGCQDNMLTNINLSQNTLVRELDCSNNQLASLDVTANTALQSLNTANNQLTLLDLTQNTNLEYFTGNNNQLETLDLSLNTLLETVEVTDNALTTINLKNGNTTSITNFKSTNNPNLSCVSVDDVTHANTYWVAKDAHTFFNEDCRQTYIPDDNFENYLETHDASGNTVSIGDETSMGNGIDNDDYVNTDDIENVTSLQIHNQNIADLTGIEDFTTLNNLNFSENQIVAVDLTSNIDLRLLTLNDNQITSMDLSGNPDLIAIIANDNQFTHLDFSANTALEFIEVQNNQLTSLNIKNGNNINFNYFDATNNPNLTCINVDDENASYLTTQNWLKDITASYGEHCYDTYVPDANFEAYLEDRNYGNGIDNDKYVTTANIVDVTSLNIFLGPFPSNDDLIADMTGIEDFTALKTLIVRKGLFQSIDVSQNLLLETLVFFDGALTSLDVTQNTALTTLTCSNNNLTTLDLTQNINLVELNCNSNNLTALDVTQNPALFYINCSRNQLTSLDITQNPLLEGLECFDNQLTSLDVSQHPVFNYLFAHDNQLTSLNVANGNNTNMTQFEVYGNPNLTCIKVDDAAAATAGMGNYNNWDKDAQASYNDVSCDIILVAPKVYLQGAAINPITGEETLMRDDLRTASLLPTTSPYSDNVTCDAAVFNTTGTDAIVDWIWVELRDANDNTLVIDAQSALLQRDGDIVAVDGISELGFNQNVSDYYIAIKHRNHLGIMTFNTVALTTNITSVDFTNENNQITHGINAQATFGMPADIVGMWTGNANGDTLIQYSGTDPDVTKILATVLNDAGNFLNFPTYSVVAYTTDDVNMDGNTQYTGTTPDLTFILQNVLAHPGNFLNFSTYQIIEQLPEN